MSIDDAALTYYRRRLSQEEGSLYDRLSALLTEKKPCLRIKVSETEPQNLQNMCRRAMIALSDDHPEFFMLGDRVSWMPAENGTILEFFSDYSPSQVTLLENKILNTVENITEGIKDLPLIQREMLIYQKITERFLYGDPYRAESHTPVWPVLTGRGNCEGINALLMLCFRKESIPCMKVRGTLEDGTAHCWSMVFINGNPIHCDVTADLGEESMDHLNLSDRQIRLCGNQFDSLGLPQCKREDLSYYSLTKTRFQNAEQLLPYLRQKYLEDPAAPVQFQAEFLKNGAELSQLLKEKLPFCQRYGNFSFQKDLKTVIIQGNPRLYGPMGPASREPIDSQCCPGTGRGIQNPCAGGAPWKESSTTADI